MTVARGYPLTSVAKRVGTSDTTASLNRYRRSLGQKIVMTEGAVRGLVRALQAGEYVALLLDQHVEPQQGGVWVNLFGLQAAVSSAAARLARKFAVPVAVCFAQALPDGRYRCRLLGACQADSDDPEPMTQRIMDLMAGAIRRYPSQWLVSYKRWKRWPVGADPRAYPFYARPWKP
jgi:lauroyl/myristoyl acyltransferase